jgi:hypothetical protein
MASDSALSREAALESAANWLVKSNSVMASASFLVLPRQGLLHAGDHLVISQTDFYHVPAHCVKKWRRDELDLVVAADPWQGARSPGAFVAMRNKD